VQNLNVSFQGGISNTNVHSSKFQRSALKTVDGDDCTQFVLFTEYIIMMYKISENGYTSRHVW